MEVPAPLPMRQRPELELRFSVRPPGRRAAQFRKLQSARRLKDDTHDFVVSIWSAEADDRNRETAAPVTPRQPPRPRGDRPEPFQSPQPSDSEKMFYVKALVGR
ncbi:hypothetical protein AHIS1636_17880 [Arthrobacter mangrovi]|uniref:Uncharacterized protein n=1 Tax=Arthrobacter mangrovi TaxID=2966350 RepID=A0ABQ5MTS4_9MICC|nr:hypothetical protein AHIS1636_17880 [Arthrobacter mangrovi]